MGQQYIDVEVIVTSTVVYRLPRPTKAEVVDHSGDAESWDKDDPEGSIREHLESLGIDDVCKGYRPISVTVDDKEVSDVYPAGKGERPLEARPMVKLRCNIRMDDGSTVEAWWYWDTFRRVGSDFMGEVATSELLAKRATPLRRMDAKRVVAMTTEQLGDRLEGIEMVPVQPS